MKMPWLSVNGTPPQAALADGPGQDKRRLYGSLLPREEAARCQSSLVPILKCDITRWLRSKPAIL